VVLKVIENNRLEVQLEVQYLQVCRIQSIGFQVLERTNSFPIKRKQQENVSISIQYLSRILKTSWTLGLRMERILN